MAGPVQVRPLSAQEDAALLAIVRGEGRQETIRVRRAVMIRASAHGARAPVIARLLDADPDTVRDVIHAFNANGLDALDPHWAAGRPRRITAADEASIVRVAKTRPRKLGRPFTHWSLRKLVDYLVHHRSHPVIIERERLRQILHAHRISFQRTRTWKQSTDPDYDAKLDRIEQVLGRWPDRCFAFDQFGPLSIRPCHGTCWAPHRHPDRIRATYHRTHGIRYFHGCLDISQDRLWGVTRLHKGGKNTLAALESIRAARPDHRKIYVILDNLSANKTPAIRAWAAQNRVELCFTPTNASWADPIEAHFGPLRSFVIGNSDYPNHLTLARQIQAYLRWRNAHPRDPEVLAAQRRERARIRSERHQRWGRPAPQAA